MDKKLSKYDPDYPYKKESIILGKSKKGYPIIERTNNGLVFPECPNDKLDMNDIKDSV